ncbi:hypothetical protein BST61_g6925 [Cercospora zeina]
MPRLSRRLGAHLTRRLQVFFPPRPVPVTPSRPSPRRAAPSCPHEAIRPCEHVRRRCLVPPMQPLHDMRSRSLSAGTCQRTSRIASPKRDFAAGITSHTSQLAPLDNKICHRQQDVAPLQRHSTLLTCNQLLFRPVKQRWHHLRRNILVIDEQHCESHDKPPGLARRNEFAETFSALQGGQADSGQLRHKSAVPSILRADSTMPLFMASTTSAIQYDIASTHEGVGIPTMAPAGGNTRDIPGSTSVSAGISAKLFIEEACARPR